MPKMCWHFGQNNYRHGIWKVAQSPINCSIRSHWCWIKINWYFVDGMSQPWKPLSMSNLIGANDVDRFIFRAFSVNLSHFKLSLFLTFSVILSPLSLSLSLSLQINRIVQIDKPLMCLSTHSSSSKGSKNKVNKWCLCVEALV